MSAPIGAGREIARPDARSLISLSTAGDRSRQGSPMGKFRNMVSVSSFPRTARETFLHRLARRKCHSIRCSKHHRRTAFEVSSVPLRSYSGFGASRKLRISCKYWIKYPEV